MFVISLQLKQREENLDERGKTGHQRNDSEDPLLSLLHLFRRSPCLFPGIFPSHFDRSHGNRPDRSFRHRPHRHRTVRVDVLLRLCHRTAARRHPGGQMGHPQYHVGLRLDSRCRSVPIRNRSDLHYGPGGTFPGRTGSRVYICSSHEVPGGLVPEE